MNVTFKYCTTTGRWVTATASYPHKTAAEGERVIAELREWYRKQGSEIRDVECTD